MVEREGRETMDLFFFLCVRFGWVLIFVLDDNRNGQSINGRWSWFGCRFSLGRLSLNCGKDDKLKIK